MGFRVSGLGLRGFLLCSPEVPLKTISEVNVLQGAFCMRPALNTAHRFVSCYRVAAAVFSEHTDKEFMVKGTPHSGSIRSRVYCLTLQRTGLVFRVL